MIEEQLAEPANPNQEQGAPQAPQSQQVEKKKILVIGAGPCGILATKHLSINNDVICVDSKEGLGGLWHYDKHDENNHPNLNQNAYYQNYGVLQSSLYEDMVSNFPKCLMTYKGFPPKKEYNQFMTTAEFNDYLNCYTAHFDIQKCMKFNTFVVKVRLAANMTEEELQKVGFNVTKRFVASLCPSESYKADKSNISYIEVDSVVVCSGHDSVPNYPKIENREVFEGDVIHMHNFRKHKLDQYKNTHVLIYGANMSAQDLVQFMITDKDKRASKVTVLGNKQLISQFEKTKAYKKEIDEGILEMRVGVIRNYLGKQSIILEDETVIDKIDNIIYATGYQYRYPFLEDTGDNLIETYNKESRCNAFGPLYRRIFSIREPNLVFLGLIAGQLTIEAMYERQAIVAKRVLDGDVLLPSKEDMLREFKLEYDEIQKYSKDFKNFFKISNREGVGSVQELNYIKMCQEIAQIPIDEEFQKIAFEVCGPIMDSYMAQGNYAFMKKHDFGSLYPENYSPNPSLF
ncbi:flavin-binding monooxygenase-like protein (macronuclear) [Tetrahymena thermophila SB210]|uniref:Flavin-binding monooxygenase-like protein n=1 Tax=Tetrahymena thermophila (strain SB210) TaxID=312017 RepID=Q23CV6_TETTS|nr:flavin-binding monooxygenase-like protein [Tetrahymena thermophila SB210]EAR94354.1 flavin-binding monooxygenase-like protein [Tetrahymena thermophila SB210]|eukprot:XP_001014930.1 flavin-binding monooxygenase-like protein [Tetrahymena thermophila SB210]